MNFLKLLLVATVSLVGCGKNLEDSAQLDAILAKAEDGKLLNGYRFDQNGHDDLVVNVQDSRGTFFLANEDTPFTGWARGSHSNGRPSYLVKFVDGKTNGPCISWYANGEKKLEGTYKDGQWDGVWTTWYANGQKESEATFKNGKVDEEWWWHENGQIESAGGTELPSRFSGN